MALIPTSRLNDLIADSTVMGAKLNNISINTGRISGGCHIESNVCLGSDSGEYNMTVGQLVWLVKAMSNQLDALQQKVWELENRV